MSPWGVRSGTGAVFRRAGSARSLGELVPSRIQSPPPRVGTGWEPGGNRVGTGWEPGGNRAAVGAAEAEEVAVEEAVAVVGAVAAVAAAVAAAEAVAEVEAAVVAVAEEIGRAHV